MAEVAGLATAIADRILEQQEAGSRISPEQFRMLVRVARMLLDNGVPWPPSVENVIKEVAKRVQQQEVNSASGKIQETTDNLTIHRSKTSTNENVRSKIYGFMQLSVFYKIIIALFSLSIFGFCLGFHAVITPEASGLAQLAASTIKMPILIAVSSIVSVGVVYVCCPLVGGKIDQIDLSQSAMSCLLITALALLPAALIELVLASLENYSLTVLFAYAALSVAGLLGCSAFAYMINIENRYNKSLRLTASAVWVVCFGLSNAELGWRMRPLIGWTGQNFTIFRHDDPGMFSQIRCELRNTFNFGGIKFPKAGEESDTKEWPC
ncbi:hypothetical protein MKK75_00510 [Methylobacterium sp. J-030]|uniref:hypothetical protein n=1 Tax=Methylobacterium sp. J-030 TaxID=2836627 RepID=UPI001FB8AE51|nr:hypothetical protein [Methylobacterium sp. J-030]MCJ2067303.1 hypothetical protein [Methylobacterium sp. J-030]